MNRWPVLVVLAFASTSPTLGEREEETKTRQSRQPRQTAPKRPHHHVFSQPQENNDPQLLRRTDPSKLASALKVRNEAKDWGTLLNEFSTLKQLQARSEKARQKLRATSSAGVSEREWRKMRIKLEDGFSAAGSTSDSHTHLRHSEPESDDEVEPDDDVDQPHLRRSEPEEEGHHIAAASLDGVVDSAAGQVAESLATAIAAQVSHDMQEELLTHTIVSYRMQEELKERVNSALGRVRVALNGGVDVPPGKQPSAAHVEADDGLWHPLAAADEWSASVSEALAKVTQRYGFLSEEVSFTRAAAIFAYVTFSIF